MDGSPLSFPRCRKGCGECACNCKYCSYRTGSAPFLSKGLHCMDTYVMYATYTHLEKARPAKVDRDNPPKDQRDVSGWKHISQPHTCQHCDRIIITHHQMKHGLVSLPHTKQQALQAEADGCHVFRLLNGSWHLIAHHHGPSDLLKLFRFLHNPVVFRDWDYMISYMDPPTAKFPNLSPQNKARLNKAARLLWKSKFILDNLRRRHFHLLVSSGRIDFLYGATAIECDGKLQIAEGMYTDRS